jgi:hypothetical protein
MLLRIKKVRRNITDGELLDDLKRVSGILRSKVVSIRQYDKAGLYNSSTFITRFGSWNRAVLLAGLELRSPRSCTKKQLLENMLEVWLKIGRQPKLFEMNYGASGFTRSVYLKIFGSWQNALEKLEKFTSSSRDAGKYITALNEMKNKAENESKTNTRKPGLRLRMAVLKRDMFRCVLCGSSPAVNKNVELEIDHIIPWSKGGKTAIDNLQALCSECNNGKSDEIL